MVQYTDGCVDDAGKQGLNYFYFSQIMELC